MATRINYDQLATEYAQHRQVNPAVVKALIEVGHIDQNTTLLEVGCGTGNYCLTLNRLTGCAGHGIDPSAAMLDQAKKRQVATEESPATIQFQAGQAEQLDFPAGTFDLVYSVDVIHHVQDRARFYQEAWRVLKPGGRLCTVTDSESVIQRRRPLSNYFPETVPVELARYPHIATLREYMLAAGFTHISEPEVEFAYPLTASQPYRDKAFSSLHLISPQAHAQGLARLEADLQAGPVAGLSLYTMLWGKK